MTQPAAIVPVATPAAPVKRGGWASDYLQRLMPETNKPAVPATTTAPTISHMKAAGRAVGDVATVGIVSGLLGVAHARGLLDHGRAALDGLLALVGLGIGIGVAPYSSSFSRLSTNVGLAGVSSLMFRKGYALAGGEPSSPTAPPPVPRTSRVGVDPIAQAAQGLDV